MKHIFLFILTLAGVWNLHAQTPQKINYQAVARDAGGQALAGANLGVKFTFLQGSVTGNIVYEETFSVTTNQLGLYNVQLGDGSPLSGNFNVINWANGPYFVEVAIDPNGGANFAVMGTSELISVPYALFAEDVANKDDADADPNNEIQSLSQSGPLISLSQNGGSVNINDADADPNNEIQTLGQNGNSVTLSGGGGTISVDDADADPNNELQSVSQSGSMITLSNGGGSFNINDNDSDPNNELQTVTQSGGTITLSNGGGTVTVDDADADPTNEIQTVSQSGSTLTLSNGGGSFTVDDADADPTNEIQTITQSGATLTLSNGGGTVSVDDADPDPTNEFQTLSQIGNSVSLSNNGGTISVDDADSDSTNEIQTLSQIDDSVSLSLNGGVFSIADQDADTTNELQQLSWNQGNMELTISNGNSVQLTGIQGGGGGSSGNFQGTGRVTFFAEKFPEEWSDTWNHSSVIMENGELKNWGHNRENQFGIGNNQGSFTTPTWTPMKDSVISVVHNYNTSYWINSDKDLYASGSNDQGQCGIGSNSSFEIYPRKVNLISNVKKVVVSGGTTYSTNQPSSCALLEDGTVWCWGEGQFGQLGNGGSGDQNNPTRAGLAIGLNDATDINMGGGYYASTCIVRNYTSLWAWGYNGYGQLGTNNTTSQPAPVPVYTSPDTIVKVISIYDWSFQTRVMLKSDGTVWTWGYNGYGQCGQGNTSNILLPTQVQGITNAIDISGGGGRFGSVFVLLADSTVRCWGSNYRGQLGIGNTVQQNLPVNPGLTGVKKIVVSGRGYANSGTTGNHTVHILKHDGTVYSMGYGADGAIGDGLTTLAETTPTQVLGICNAIDIYSGGSNSDSHCCVILDDGRMRCWGRNGNGQVGSGNNSNTSVPNRVKDLDE